MNPCPIIFYTSLLLFCPQAHSQDKLDVEGSARIIGLLHLQHGMDSTSVIAGPYAGINMDGTISFASSDLENTLFGFKSGENIISGFGNVFLGSESGKSTQTGRNNVFIGKHAGRMATIPQNSIFLGSFSGYSSQGADNVLIGNYSGYAQTNGSGNVHLGSNSGRRSTTGSLNTYVGFSAGYENQGGTRNTYLGARSGVIGNMGSDNTFAGHYAGYKNRASFNCFFGAESGMNDSLGQFNSFFGYQSGVSTSDGNSNTFVGAYSGEDNTLGSVNTFIGISAGNNNTIGSLNTFVGTGAGQANQPGEQNTILGTSADVSGGNLFNATAIGYGTVVDANNKIRLGNNQVTVIEGQVSLTASSDRRLKEKIQPLDTGLDFINQLNPVSYHRINNEDTTLELGLIAQELELILKKNQWTGYGLLQRSENDFLAIRYNDLLAPLIKAIQELSAQNQNLIKEVRSLKAQVSDKNLHHKDASVIQLSAKQ